MSDIATPASINAPQQQTASVATPTAPDAALIAAAQAAQDRALEEAIAEDRRVYESHGIKFKVVEGGGNKNAENVAQAQPPAEEKLATDTATPASESASAEFTLPSVDDMEAFLQRTPAKQPETPVEMATAMEIARRDLEIQNLRAELAKRTQPALTKAPVTFEVPDALRAYYANAVKGPDGKPNEKAADNLVGFLGPLIETAAEQIVERRFGGMKEESAASADYNGVIDFAERAIDASLAQYFGDFPEQARATFADTLAERVAAMLQMPNHAGRRLKNMTIDPLDRSIPAHKRHQFIVWYTANQAQQMRQQWAHMTPSQKAAAASQLAVPQTSAGTPSFDPGVGGRPASMQVSTSPEKYALGKLALRARAA